MRGRKAIEESQNLWYNEMNFGREALLKRRAGWKGGLAIRRADGATAFALEKSRGEGESAREPGERNLRIEDTVRNQQDERLIAMLQSLPIDYWDFRDDDTKEYTHGLHNYPAMMVCPISRNIIEMVRSIRPVDALFDPFSGSGTVLVEGMLAGLRTVAGNDINPLALLLTKVKTTPIPHAKLADETGALLSRIQNRYDALSPAIEAVDSYIADALELDVADKKGWGDEAPKYLRRYCEASAVDVQIPDFKNIGYWFRPRAILELAVLKEEIEKIADADVRDFVFVALSECIRFVSNRRNGEFKMFRMPVPKVRQFRPDVYREFRGILARNLQKMDDFCNALESARALSDVFLYRNNACALEDVPDEAYDLVVTSPPYGDSRTTVAYGEFSRLSLQWINAFDLTEREIMGVDKSLMGGKKYRSGFDFSLPSPTLRDSLERILEADVERAGDVYSFYEDLDASIRSIAKKTRSGGYQFWVVGNRTVKNELLRTDAIIPELAARCGLAHVYTVGRNIPNKVMPSRNSPSNVRGAKGATMTMEHIVILRKQ